MPRWPSREFANRIKPRARARAGTKKRREKEDEKRKKERGREKIRERERERERTRRFTRIKVPAIFTYANGIPPPVTPAIRWLLPTDRCFSIGAPRAVPRIFRAEIARHTYIQRSRDIKILIILFYKYMVRMGSKIFVNESLD